MNTISTFRKCTLTNEELLKAVDKGTDKMYIEGKIPSRCIPAQPNADYDLLVGELILRFIELTKQLQQGGVVRPEAGSVQEGELLGNGECKAGAMEVLDIKTGQLLSVDGYGFVFAKDLNTGEIKCFNVENVSGESREEALL